MKKLFFAFVLSFFALSTFAQKVGHLNTGLLLESMPEVKAADAELETLQKQLVAKGEGMVKAFQTNYNKIITDVNSGTLTPKQQQEKQTELQKKQQEIQKYEQEVQAQILKKREELLQPILQKVDEAIKAVGKEGNFLFIFDTSVPQVMLFAEESLDVTAAVKSKLGI